MKAAFRTATPPHHRRTTRKKKPPPKPQQRRAVQISVSPNTIAKTHQQRPIQHKHYNYQQHTTTSSLFCVRRCSSPLFRTQRWQKKKVKKEAESSRPLASQVSASRLVM
ncbi:Hypothetical predicted protein [Olea europaea subsp. europaea]|uniref:Uncharacterized protein n=1 Tax=Olea europaea subsp. europaea TaxID=158383 RepID=A0A8S0UA72_OLEEU|nr:Hypothetical predicted protein [Olea europaea subsp. europaea]